MKKPNTCAGCEFALFEGNEAKDCIHDPSPPNDEPSDGKPCRYWTRYRPYRPKKAKRSRP